MENLTGDAFRRMFEGGLAALTAERPRIDNLNVFPVPDGDTGTNLHLTLEAAVRASSSDTDGLAGAVRALARGSLLGARGNSGVIFSQWCKGLSEALEHVETAGGRDVAEALRRASEAAYAAVLEPVEGTLLTVVREAAEAAERAADEGAGAGAVLRAAYEAARKAVAQTPALLEVLREAGVVDAGGEGFVTILRGALAAVKVIDEKVNYSAIRVEVEAAPARPPAAAARPAEAASIEFRYCTEVTVQGEGMDLEATRRSLAPLGDCLMVVGDPETMKIHIHTNSPGRVLEIGCEWGELVDVKVENMVEQNRQWTSATGLHDAAESSGLSASPANGAQTSLDCGVVAVVRGEGFREILQGMGVHAFVEGGPSMNPSTEEIMQAAQALHARRVVIMPNHRNVLQAAQQAAELLEETAVVVPTESMPEAVAAMVRFDPELDADELVAAMTEEAKSVRVGEVTRAAADREFFGVRVRKGQAIGLAEGRIQSVSDDLEEAAAELAQFLTESGGELLTIYYGTDVSPKQAETLRDRIVQARPELEVEMYPGGQPLYPYLLAVE